MEKKDEMPIMPEDMMSAQKHTFVSKTGRVITAVAIVGITMLGSVPVAQAGDDGTSSDVLISQVDNTFVQPTEICIIKTPICVQGNVPICVLKTSE